MKKLSSGLIVCLLSASVSLAHASAYIGASVGQTDVDIPNFSNGNSFVLTGGYKINQHFAVEGAYINLGESDYDIAPEFSVEASGINLSAVGILPVNETIDIFAKVGMYMWDISLELDGYGELYSNDGTDLSIGLGTSIDITEQFGVVIEYQAFEVDDADMSNISLGARVNF